MTEILRPGQMIGYSGWGMEDPAPAEVEEDYGDMLLIFDNLQKEIKEKPILQHYLPWMLKQFLAADQIVFDMPLHVFTAILENIHKYHLEDIKQEITNDIKKEDILRVIEAARLFNIDVRVRPPARRPPGKVMNYIKCKIGEKGDIKSLLEEKKAIELLKYFQPKFEEKKSEEPQKDCLIM